MRLLSTITPVVDVQKFYFTVYDDGDWANEAIPVWQTPDGKAVTITKVRSAVIGATSPALAFNIEERPSTAVGSAGTDICSGEISADADGTVTTSFSNASIAADAYLVLTTAGSAVETGTVDLIAVSIYYTVN